MQKTFVSYFISPGLPVISFFFLCYLAVWAVAFFYGGNAVFYENLSPAATAIQSAFSQYKFLLILLSCSVSILNAILLVVFSNRFILVSTRSILPAFIFLLLICVWSCSYTALYSHLTLTLFIAALFSFFKMYHDKKAAEHAYIGSFLIACASIIIPEYAFLLLVCWIALFSFKSFSLRTFLASIIGILTPFILYFSCFYLFDGNVDFSWFLNHFIIETTLSISDFSGYFLIYVVIIFFILVFCTISVYADFSKNTIHTRKNLNFILFIFLFSIAIRTLYTDTLTSIMPLTVLASTIFLSHTFTLKQTKFWRSLFLCFFLINILFAFIGIFLPR